MSSSTFENDGSGKGGDNSSGDVAALLRAFGHELICRVVTHQKRGGATLSPDVLPDRVTCRIEDEELAVRVVVSLETIRPHDPLVELTPCQKDILRLLGQQSRPVTAERIMELLERDGRIHGMATICKALGKLMSLGLIKNRRRLPRGYYCDQV